MRKNPCAKIMKINPRSAVRLHTLVFIYIMSAMVPHEALSTLYEECSSLEREVVDDGLLLYDLLPDIPDSKVVRNIYVITASPFSKDAGLLTLLNYLHVNTRESVIKREIFQKEGVIYDPAAVRDSEMALRGQGLVRSLAVIVPVKKADSEDDEYVDLLVATKDLLSLQPAFTFKGSGKILTNFMFALGEYNLLGYNKSVAAIYEWQQAGHIISARYFDPSFLNTRLQLTVKPSFVFSREKFKFDGILGEFKVERPLLSQTQEWGYGISMNLGTRPIIDFSGGKVRTFEIRSTNGVETYQRKYRWRYGKGSIGGRRSFGGTYKKEIFASYGLNIKRPTLLGDQEMSESLKEIYRKNVLPKDEVESFVTLGFAYFHNQFLKLYDYDNYKVQETERIGPHISISNDFSSKRILFSDHNFLRPELKASYLQPLYKDSFINLSVATSNRFDGEFNDNLYKTSLTLVSPKISGVGRLVFDGKFNTVDHDRDNQKFVLGSDNGVRGVESRFYSGTKGFRTNLEFRTVPLELWIFYAGMVAFYDVGSAFDSIKNANLTHAIGIGFRVLAPQVSSVPFRIDFAFPIYGVGRDRHIVVPSFGTGQAF